jgi:hypothetical protein
LRKEPDLAEAPLLVDLAKTPAEEAIYRFISSDTAMAFPVVAPPCAAPDLVDALRKAFAQTMADPAFLADAEKRGLSVRFVSGDDVQAIVRSLIGTPTEVITVLKRSIEEARLSR